ncbi:hypothetical protein [Collinsella sp. TF10-11AT]|uniref:hypothetical protein n=1 Tax=Collinsella sp. TF10-11AT TaxID=2292335 RepID=UPI0011C149B3|nr:hypothetical protein [Collinsella sp. TF10-11AT]
MPNLPAETFNKAKLKQRLSVACNKIKYNKIKETPTHGSLLTRRAGRRESTSQGSPLFGSFSVENFFELLKTRDIRKGVGLC